MQQSAEEKKGIANSQELTGSKYSKGAQGLGLKELYVRGCNASLVGIFK